MRVGIMISPIRSVPPTGGVISAPGNFVVELADGLTRKGHAVYLFAARGSTSKATVCDFEILPTSKQERMLPKDQYIAQVRRDEALLFEHMVAYGSKVDIQLFHLHQVLGMKSLISLAPASSRFVITLHDPIEGENKDALLELSSLPNVRFVSLTHAQQQGIDATVASRFAGTVPHGTDTLLFAFAPESKGYVAVIGRILPKKGQDDAIQVAREANTPLYIIGKQYDDTPEHTSFWEQRIAPHIDSSAVTYVPVIPRTSLPGYYQGAKALLMPIKWEEPFGLVMIEAMSCGTPVIAYNRGSVPEIVQDGVTGYIIDPDPPAGGHVRPGSGTWTIKKQGIEGLAEGIRRIGEIDRAACRKHVEDHFSLEKMVEGYEQVYANILASKGDALRS